MSSRTYKARPLRTFLTIFGMSIGMSAVMFLVSLGNGLQEEMLRRITTADTLYALSVRAPQGKGDDLMTSSRGESIRRLPGVVEANGARTFEGLGKMNGLTSNMAIVFPEEGYLRLSGARTIAGTTDFEKGQSRAIVTTGVARIFGSEPSALVGNTVELYASLSQNERVSENASSPAYQAFTVAGVVESEEMTAYIPEEFLSADPKGFVYGDMRVRTSSQQNLQRVRSELVNLGYDVSAIADTVRQVEVFFTAVRFVMGFFGIIALFVSAIGMFNTMTVALLERTQEIGIMKAIGASDRYIAALFMIEAFLMGLCGGALGVLIAYVEMAAVGGVVNFAAERFGGSALQLFSTPMWFLALILVFSGAVGIVTGFIPAQRASKLDTLKAIQYK